MINYMKQWINVLLITVGIIFIFTNCKNSEKSFDNFYQNEKSNLLNATTEILSKLGLNNYDISIYAHRSINNRVISKNVADTNWSGSGFSPENQLDSTIAFRDMSNLYGRVRQRTMTVNYELTGKREIAYDNFSILIIIENINQRQREELLNILDSYLLNLERGDTIFIISKEDFYNLK